MKPSFAITSQLEVGGSQVAASITARDAAYELKPTDKLTIVVGSEAPVTLVDDGNGSYGAALDIKDSGTPVTMSLDCGAGKAPSSTVTMTEQLGLLTPAPGTQLSRANDDIAMSWGSDPSADPLRASWSGDCVKSGSIEVDHTATTVTIPKGSIVATDPTATCDVAIAIGRTRTGSLDKAFGGGAITHTFMSSAHITSAP